MEQPPLSNEELAALRQPMPSTYGAMPAGYPTNWQPTPMLPAIDAMWCNAECVDRQPKYDWQLTVRFARNNGVKLV